MFAIAGVPAVYFNAMIASKNDIAAMQESGSARSINRTRLERTSLEAELAEPANRSRQSLDALRAMLRWRQSTGAFDPAAEQIVLDTAPGVIGIERRGEGGETARVYVNTSSDVVAIEDATSGDVHGSRFGKTPRGYDLGPWGMLWLIDR